MTPGGGTARSAELVTVAIPARNESATIAGVLDSVLAQTYEHLQIIVVDGDSDDDTRRIVQDYADRDPRVELLDNPDRVIPVAMNLALERARGVFLVRVDAHCRVPADYVERLVTHLRTGQWGGVGGRKDARGRTRAGRAIAAVMGSRFAQGDSVYHYGDREQVVDHIPFGSYPVELCRELGGWTETQLVNEDYEFDYRVRLSGKELLFDPEVVIDWDCRQSVPELFRQYRRYGRGKVQTLERHPSSASPRHLAAPTLVMVLAAAASLLPWRRTRHMGLLMLAPYVGLVGIATATTAPKVSGFSGKLWVAPAFVAIHTGWGTGFWLEVFDHLGER